MGRPRFAVLAFAVWAGASAGCAASSSGGDDDDDAPAVDSSVAPGDAAAPGDGGVGHDATRVVDGGAGNDAALTGTVKFIAIGDQGEGNPEQMAIATRMDTWCGTNGCDFVVLLGDNFYSSGVANVADTQWASKFEDIYDKPNLNGLPFYAVLGNHDYMGEPQAQVDYALLPVGTTPGTTRKSLKWRMPARYYTATPSPLLHLFALDTTPPMGQDPQKMAMTLSAMTSTAPWKISLAHHPRYTAGSHYFDNEALGSFGEMFALQESIFCHTNVYLTGHDHSRQFYDKGRSSACPNTYFVISGGGSKTTPRNSFTEAAARATEGKNLFYDATEPGFAYFVATPTSLKIQFVDGAGIVDFERTLTRP